MLKLLYITKDPAVALAAESAGVDWIFVDMEIRGKEERQGHLDTVISRHTVDDVRSLRSVLTKAQLLARVNPWGSDSRQEITETIDAGADIVMLPYFHTAAEVGAFVRSVDGRARTCLLLETPDAVRNLEAILAVPGIDYVHIGLNDLHLGYGLTFMFELFANGTVEKLAGKIRPARIPFGVGGVGRIGEGTLPATTILGEHYRLGSEAVILSRAFLDHDISADDEYLSRLFKDQVRKIRDYEEFLTRQDPQFFEANSTSLRDAVQTIVDSKVGSLAS